MARVIIESLVCRSITAVVRPCQCSSKAAISASKSGHQAFSWSRSPRDKRAAISSFLCCGASLFGGHIFSAGFPTLEATALA